MGYVLRDEVVLAETDGGLALLDGASGEYYSLNPSGGVVLRALLAGADIEQAARRIIAAYDVDLATALLDTNALVGELRDNRLLVSGTEGA